MEQFFYSRKEMQPPKDGDTEPQFKVFTDSFPVERILRTTEFQEGQIVIVLADGHEEAHDVWKDVLDKDNKPKIAANGRPIQEIKRERGWYATQVILSPEDTQRFWAKYKQI